MQKNKKIDIEISLYEKIKDYASENGYDIALLINKLLKKGFDMEVYGDAPFYTTVKERKVKEIEEIQMQEVKEVEKKEENNTTIIKKTRKLA